MEVLKVKILVIQTAFPGDAILSLPLIQIVHDKFPNSTIDVLCIPATKIIFVSSPSVSSVITFDKKQNEKGISGLISIIKKIRDDKYDKVISSHRSARSSLIAYFSGAKNRISFNKSALSFLYTEQVEYRSDWHEVKRNLSLLGADEPDDWKVLPILEADQNVKNLVEQKLNNISSDKLIAVAPGSVWETKKYPIEKFKSIVEVFIEEGFHIIVIGGANDRKLGEILLKVNSNRVSNFCGELNFIESYHLLSKVKLLISNDSAPTHLGVAADIPVLTIFCSTIPGFGFYPYNKNSRTISIDDLYCKPCGIHGHKKCPEEHFRCAHDLTPNKVIRAVKEMLSEGHSVDN